VPTKYWEHERDSFVVHQERMKHKAAATFKIH